MVWLYVAKTFSGQYFMLFSRTSIRSSAEVLYYRLLVQTTTHCRLCRKQLGLYTYKGELKNIFTGSTIGSGIVYPFWATEFILISNGVHVAQTLVFCIISTIVSLIIHFIPSPTKLRWDIVMLPSVLRNILVNTLESTSFNGFWLNLVHT